MGKNFGPLLRKYRRASQKTLGEVARHLGFKASYISDIEHGRRAPLQFERLPEIADFLRPHADLDQLVRAAAADRGAFELPAEGVSPRAREVGSMLMRGWRNLTDEDLQEISRIINSRGKES